MGKKHQSHFLPNPTGQSQFTEVNCLIYLLVQCVEWRAKKKRSSKHSGFYRAALRFESQTNGSNRGGMIPDFFFYWKLWCVFFDIQILIQFRVISGHPNLETTKMCWDRHVLVLVAIRLKDSAAEPGSPRLRKNNTWMKCICHQTTFSKDIIKQLGYQSTRYSYLWKLFNFFWISTSFGTLISQTTLGFWFPNVGQAAVPTR